MKIDTKNKDAKFHSNIFIFDCAMTKKKTGTGDDVIFLKRDFLTFIIVVHKNRHFWNPETTLDKIDMVL